MCYVGQHCAQLVSLTGACESGKAGKALGADWTKLAYACCAADWELTQIATTSELSFVLQQRSQCCTAAAGLRACKVTEKCSMRLVDHGSGAVPSTKRPRPSTLQIQSNYALYALEAGHPAAHEATAL